MSRISFFFFFFVELERVLNSVRFLSASSQSLIWETTIVQYNTFGKSLTPEHLSSGILW